MDAMICVTSSLYGWPYGVRGLSHPRVSFVQTS